jgi:DNA repair exonuclease SbcCD ATPase subunit
MEKIISKLVAVLVAISLAGPGIVVVGAEGPDLGYGTISGTVREIDGITPISGATVIADNLEAITNENGVYLIENVPVGSYTVTASADGYKDNSVIDVLVENGEVTTVNFTLEAALPLGKEISALFREIIIEHKAAVDDFIEDIKYLTAAAHEERLSLIENRQLELSTKIDEINARRQELIEDFENGEISREAFVAALRELAAEINATARSMSKLGERLGAIGAELAENLRRRAALLVVANREMASKMVTAGRAMGEQMRRRGHWLSVEMIENAYEQFSELMENFQEEIWEMMEENIEILWDLMENFREELLEMIEENLYEGISDLMENFHEEILGIMRENEGISELVENFYEQCSEMIKENLCEELPDLIENLFEGIKESIKENVERAEDLYEKLSEQIEEFYEKLSEITERISELRSEHPGINLDNVLSKIQEAREEFNVGNLELALRILDVVEDLLDQLMEELGEIGPPIENVGPPENIGPPENVGRPGAPENAENVYERTEEFYEKLSEITERISELRSEHPGINLDNVLSKIQEAREEFNVGNLELALRDSGCG